MKIRYLLLFLLAGCGDDKVTTDYAISHVATPDDSQYYVRIFDLKNAKEGRTYRIANCGNAFILLDKFDDK